MVILELYKVFLVCVVCELPEFRIARILHTESTASPNESTAHPPVSSKSGAGERLLCSSGHAGALLIRTLHPLPPTLLLEPHDSLYKYKLFKAQISPHSYIRQSSSDGVLGAASGCVRRLRDNSREKWGFGDTMGQPK